MDGDKVQVSFGFKKKIQSKVDESKLVRDKDNQLENKDFIGEIDASVKKENDKKELVIPLIQRNRWKNVVTKNVNSSAAKQTENLDSKAAKELLQESQQFLDKASVNDNEQFDSMAVPLLLKNKVPDGFETDERLNVALRADQASLADYGEIPIEAFGMAMIRGMGWDPKVGIGRTFKQNTKVLEANVRPKGLGLGASSIKTKGNSTQQSPTEEKLEVKKGAYVLVKSGSHNRKYGVVTGIDPDNAQCLVKLALDGKTASIGQFALKVVNSKEYKNYGKDLSRLSAAYVEKDDKKSPQKRGESNGSTEERHKHKKRKYEQDNETSTSRRTHKHELNKVEKHAYDDDGQSNNLQSTHSTDKKQRSRKTKSRTWLRPHLRVRMVNENFKKGRYYREKLVVEDVLDAYGKCTCRTDGGSLLDGITEDMLETVVPRSSSDAYVIIITKGRLKYDGKLAKILEKDKSSCEAYLQLLEDRDVALRVSFDEMCEYAGDIEAEAAF